MTTRGDRNKSSPLAQIGGKGVFVKELETALLDGRADIAVHSMKDVPADLPEGLAITGICERADPRDVLVSNRFDRFDALPPDAITGSGCTRRRLQLQQRYPHLEFRDLRGNVDTRLKRLDVGDYDAIILAAAGLHRLGQSARIAQRIGIDVCIPAAGQGAVGIESRVDDTRVRGLVRTISHKESFTCVNAERSVTAALGATCTLPVAVHAQPQGGRLAFRSFVSNLAGTRVIRASLDGPFAEAQDLAKRLGEKLIARGALDLIGETHDGSMH